MVVVATGMSKKSSRHTGCENMRARPSSGLLPEGGGDDEDPLLFLSSSSSSPRSEDTDENSPGEGGRAPPWRRCATGSGESSAPPLVLPLVDTVGQSRSRSIRGARPAPALEPREGEEVAGEGAVVVEVVVVAAAAAALDLEEDAVPRPSRSLALRSRARWSSSACRSRSLASRKICMQAKGIIDMSRKIIKTKTQDTLAHTKAQEQSQTA